MIWGSNASAQTGDIVRIATFAAPLSRDGPGLLLRDITKQDDAGIAAIVAIINHISPDILILTQFFPSCFSCVGVNLTNAFMI
jgi:hypothetical protein